MGEVGPLARKLDAYWSPTRITFPGKVFMNRPAAAIDTVNRS